MKTIRFPLFLVALLFLLSTCKKDAIIEVPEETPAPPAQPDTSKKDSTSLIVSFIAMANNAVLKPTTGSYTNSSGDNFTVTKLNYYISNVRLIRDDGFVFVEPESYHIVKHVDGLTSFNIHKLPEGKYISMEFLIGVDSLRNVSGAQTGPLDVSNQMFWEWESGYIFFKLEGTYVSNTVTQDGEYTIHIGGFKGKFSCLQKCSLNLADPIIAKAGRVSRLYYNTVVDEIFKAPKKIGFDTYYASISDSMFNLISVNYKDMFVVAKVEN